MTEATDADRKAIVRCYCCAEDGQDTDIGRPALARLVDLGWVEMVGRSRWQNTRVGDVIAEAEINAGR